MRFQLGDCGFESPTKPETVGSNPNLGCAVSLPQRSPSAGGGNGVTMSVSIAAQVLKLKAQETECLEIFRRK